ncbi:MAG TPA: hypothetical protein VFU72_03980, partial [Nitrolancea sp.]|nr:hypothetical protein [Nitrolancea sp.]
NGASRRGRRGRPEPASLRRFPPCPRRGDRLVEIAAFLLVLFTAIYGSTLLSERAFRALRLITNRGCRSMRQKNNGYL